MTSMIECAHVFINGHHQDAHHTAAGVSFRLTALSEAEGITYSVTSLELY